jgi:type IV secretion system protein VirD4
MMPLLDGLVALGQWSQRHPQILMGGIAGGFVLMGTAHVLSRGRRGARDTHGSARWATAREIRKSGLSRQHGVVIGTMHGETFYDNGPMHVLLCAPTRAGKGVFHIQPTLRTWRHSALVLDPKRGENYAATHALRAQWGHRVEAFTPYETPHCCINVLNTIRRGQVQEHSDALTVMHSLVAPEKLVKETSASLHFRELAAMLGTAGLLHLCYTLPAPSLVDAWIFFTQQHRTLAGCLKTLRTTAHTPYGVHPTIAQLTTAIQNISGDRELSSVWTTLIRPLSLYADPLVAASTSTSTVALDDLQYGPVPLSLYLLAPSPRSLERLHPVYRVIVDVAMARLMEHPAGAALHRLLVCAEELPAYGYTHALNKGAGDMAGYGIKGFYVIQDLDQFEETYGEKNTIWGNTDTKIFHAPNNDRTAERISRYLLGPATVANPVASQQGLAGRTSVSYQVVERSLMTADEVQGMNDALVLVRRTGSKPMLLHKLGYDPAKKET